jgi:hypothetical protein
MLVVGAFFGGMALQKLLDQPVSKEKWGIRTMSRWSGVETMTLRDGTTWRREFEESLSVK